LNGRSKRPWTGGKAKHENWRSGRAGYFTAGIGKRALGNRVWLIGRAKMDRRREQVDPMGLQRADVPMVKRDRHVVHVESSPTQKK
jgi:hypothetical protein